MSISTTTDIVGPFAVTWLPIPLTVSYPFQLSTDLLVYSTGSTALPVYPATLLTLNSDYTVTGGGYDVAGNMQTGSVIINASGAHDVQVGENIVIVRRPPQDQLTSFLSTGLLTAAMIERALDKLTTLVQALQDGVNRSIRVTDVDSALTEATVEDRAGKIPGFDSNGNLRWVGSTADPVVALTTHDQLRAVATVNGATSINVVRVVAVTVGGVSTPIAEQWMLIAGTTPDDDTNFIKPADFNASTNAYVWARIA